MIHLACQYFLNHRLEKDELRTQVRQLAEAGYECVYAHARAGLLTPYGSRAWFDAMRRIMAGCCETGAKFGIWDEDYYPSPSAGGRIAWNHPELRAQTLEFDVSEARAGQRIEREFAVGVGLLHCFAVSSATGACRDITEYCGTIRTNWNRRWLHYASYGGGGKIPAPHWRAGLAERRYAIDWTADEDCRIVAVLRKWCPGEAKVDLLNPETTRRFIGYTHEKYRETFSPEEWSRVALSFMDEPAVAGEFPWTDAFPEEFRKDHGFELEPELPHLALDINGRTHYIRYCYRMTQHRLLCQNYLKQIQDYCREHGVTSSGHLTRTEFISLSGVLWPDELACCRYLDLPCTDPLGANFAWADAPAYHTGIKVVSSAAHLFGKEQAGSDSFAVTGNETSLADVKACADFHMVLGVTHFNVHGISYSLDGPRKDEVPPSLFYQHSEWPMMKTLLTYIRETAEVLASGEPVIQLALYYPAEDLFCERLNYVDSPVEATIHQTVEALLSHQKDFDFADGATIVEKVAADAGAFVRRYPVLLLANVRLATSAELEALEQYAAAGGRLIVAGSLPRVIDRDDAVWHAGEAFSVPDVASVLNSLPGAVLAGEGANDVFVQRRLIDGENYAFLFNRAEHRTFRGTLAGVPVEVPPRGSRLLRPGECDGETPEISDADYRLESTTFGDNQVPLAFWQVRNGNDTAFSDLLARQANPFPEGENELSWQADFLYSGSVGRFRLLTEESTCNGASWRCFVNDVDVTCRFAPETVFDCRNRVADIADAIRSGSTPTRNTVTFIVSGPGRELAEMPWLLGEFSVEFRYAHRSLPRLEGHDLRMDEPAFTDWRDLGFPSYSGGAVSTGSFEVPADGRYALDFGRVANSIAISVDGGETRIRIAPPYRSAVAELKQGFHRFTVEVRNDPGNRERIAMRAAGVLGPVKLLRYVK